MSKLTFISNANAHVATGNITDVAAGVSGIWNLTTNDWQATGVALTAADRIQVVQGRGAGVYPIFSQIFDCKGLKTSYQPVIQPVLGLHAVAITAAGAGTVHSFKIIRRATGTEYSDVINGSTDYGFTDQVTHIEYVEVTGDTATTIGNAMAASINALGESYGFLADATTTPGTVDVYPAVWTHEFDVVNSLPVANTVTKTAAVFGSGNYWQVLADEKATQAMHGYHSRAGSFLQTPDTYTSTAIAANPAIVAGSAPTPPTQGYDAWTLHVPNSTSGNAANDASAETLITIYADSVNANNTERNAFFGTTTGTASIQQL